MRILVMSDTHRSELLAERAVKAQPTAEYIIHLGDGASDLDYVSAKYPQKSFLGVAGNCDILCELPKTRIMTVAGKRIFMLHGHTENVKYSLDSAICAAREQNADILLYGHTHTAYTAYKDGLYIMNPGSLSYDFYASYGVIDIEPNGVLLNIISADKLF